jgi:secreted trypsin-like serine protease
LTGVVPGDEVNYMVGIVSYGTQKCGGGSIGVYVNVANYMPWILENLSTA